MKLSLLFGWAIFLAVSACLIEGAASVGAILWSHAPRTSLPAAFDQYLAQPRYQTADGQAYWREFNQAGSEYADALIWRRKDMHGRYINIVNGERVQPIRSARPKIVVGIFGGSAVWGTGVKDADTLPAQIAWRMPEWDVHNYGEGGYVSWQDLTRFEILLRAGTHLDLAIFYDGLNDVQAGCIDPGIPGSSLLYRNLAPRLERDQLWRSRAVEMTARVFSSRLEAYHAPTCDAQRVAWQLEQNWQFANLLATHTYPGATTAMLTFAQPVHSPDDVYAQVYRLMDDRVKIAAPPSDEWIDFAHLTPEGNARVAEQIVSTWTGFRGLH